MVRYLLITGFAIAGSAYAVVDVRTIIQQSVSANQADWVAAPRYSWTEEDRTSRGDRTYDVTMIDGSPWRRLIKVDGMPLPPDAQKRERQKLLSVRVRRDNESPEVRQERIARYQRQRQRDQLLMDQLSKAFDFTLTGNQTIGSRDVYVLRATPRQGYKPPNKEARVLTGMEGQLWIDTRTFQWVKVTAHVIHPVSIIDFLARVEPGTEFELEKSPVTESVWLPSHFAMKSRSRVLSIFGHHTEEDETYSDYKPISR